MAVMRGPLVYCLEEADNGGLTAAAMLDTARPLAEEWLPDKLNGIVQIRARGTRLVEEGSALYSDQPPEPNPPR